MICSSCGATIADKAIVCYRCGTPTALPAAKSTRPAARRGGRPPVVALVLILVGVLVAAFSLLSDTVASWGPSMRAIGTAVGVVVGIVGAWILVRRR
jgi:hypothetical protein